MSLKIGTVFSGIGAVEFALKRMDVKHEVVFACDNGNIDIDIDFDQELNNIRGMSTIIDKMTYVDNLYKKNTKRTNFVKRTYTENYEIINDLFFQDAKLLDGYDFRKKIDILMGGTPCQSFSSIGSRGGLDDTRGTLFYDFVRLVNEIQPKVFIFENVYGLFTHDKGNTWKVMKKVFGNLNYHFNYEVLDAKDFGIPQGRRRVFVVGFLDGNECNKFKFPKGTELRYTMHDFLLDNVKYGNFQSVKGAIHLVKGGEEVEERYFLSEKLKKYVLSPGTKNFMHRDAKIDLPVARAILSTQGNSHRSSVNNYVTSKGRIRALHPRESLRLMGFTDDFKVPVSVAQAYKQSGNSVVVDVLIHLLKNIFEVTSFE